jgi:glycogen synthase
MAASLVVVAPDGGGPATYVEQGVTGILTDTSSSEALASAVLEALDLARSPQTLMAQKRALATLRERFSIDAMADALACVYAGASGRATDATGETAPADASAHVARPGTTHPATHPATRVARPSTGAAS